MGDLYPGERFITKEEPMDSFCLDLDQYLQYIKILTTAKERELRPIWTVNNRGDTAELEHIYLRVMRSFCSSGVTSNQDSKLPQRRD
ncbi:hypothetical protein NDU88_008822 [Pleurodeles waltl]|uniref:Uncharacterized protein n=1 Tax=Pleurodeles waltl TaxID=8319 RepID=A0AAV7PQX4_PLEWA|nr:hypothetical protein NDU88_008822 [Pleurodeles waltl]